MTRVISSVEARYDPNHGCCNAFATVHLAAGLVFMRDRIKSLAGVEMSPHNACGKRSTTFPVESCSNSGNLATSITYTTAPNDQQSAGKP